MPTRKRPEIEIKQFSKEEIKLGIKKIQRRIKDVESLDPTKIKYNDAYINHHRF